MKSRKMISVSAIVFALFLSNMAAVIGAPRGGARHHWRVPPMRRAYTYPSIGSNYHIKPGYATGRALSPSYMLPRTDRWKHGY